ncbi:MAG TPA: DUF5996 family protein [Gammaproteobacteria bacterium]
MRSGKDRLPDAAFYSADRHDFVLPSDIVRQSASPDGTLLEFLQTIYAATTDLGGWDRAALERSAS